MENLFAKFFTYPPWFDRFCAYCRTTFSGLILPVSARTCLTLPIPLMLLISSTSCSFLWCFSCVQSLHQHWLRKTLKQRGFFSSGFFRHNLPSLVRQIVWLLLYKAHLFSHDLHCEFGYKGGFFMNDTFMKEKPVGPLLASSWRCLWSFPCL